MTDISMMTAAPATLSESELFAIFLNLPITTRSSFGSLKHTGMVDDYVPDDYLLNGGNWGEIQDATIGFKDWLLSEDKPGEALGDLISALEGYLVGLRVIERDYQPFVNMHAIEPNAEGPVDRASEEYNAWKDAWKEHERNPRFSVPIFETMATSETGITIDDLTDADRADVMGLKLPGAQVDRTATSADLEPTLKATVELAGLSPPPSIKPLTTSAA